MKPNLPLMSNALTFDESVEQTLDKGVGLIAVVKDQMEANNRDVQEKFAEFDKNYSSEHRVVELSQDVALEALEDLFLSFKPNWVVDIMLRLGAFLLNENVKFILDYDDAPAVDITEKCRTALLDIGKENAERAAHEVATRYAKQVSSISMWMKTGYIFPEQATAFFQVDPAPILAVRLMDKLLLDTGCIQPDQLSVFLLKNDSLSVDDSGPVLMGLSDGVLN